MLNNLPEAIRDEILQLLKADNFRAAKQLYERWLEHH